MTVSANPEERSHATYYRTRGYERQDSQQVTHGPDEETPAEAVCFAVAEFHGVSELSLDPLSNVIDPDALNRLFAPTTKGDSRRTGTITFEYEGLRVTVGGHETVRLAPSE